MSRSLRKSINDATRDELRDFLSQNLTDRIMRSKQREGPFSSWPDLIERVPGLGDGKQTLLQRAGYFLKGEPIPQSRPNSKPVNQPHTFTVPPIPTTESLPRIPGQSAFYGKDVAANFLGFGRVFVCNILHTTDFLGEGGSGETVGEQREISGTLVITLVQLARLGNGAALAATVGIDTDADMVQEKLFSSNVTTAYIIKQKQGLTSFVTEIHVENPEKQPEVTVYRSFSRETFDIDLISHAMIRGFNQVLFDGSSVAAGLKLAEIARENNVQCSMIATESETDAEKLFNHVDNVFVSAVLVEKLFPNVNLGDAVEKMCSNRTNGFVVGLSRDKIEFATKIKNGYDSPLHWLCDKPSGIKVRLEYRERNGIHRLTAYSWPGYHGTMGGVTGNQAAGFLHALMQGNAICTCIALASFCGSVAGTEAVHTSGASRENMDTIFAKV
eukprot:m.3337 g.3337  ORF g.3337 m.3337 type:complete len:443 (+) comp2752_c0_seq1:291-1619(+)